MSNSEHRKHHPTELRQRAEKMARTALLEKENCTAISPKEIEHVIHELCTHQIELEMQNEELRSAHQKIDENKARYFDLYDMAPVGYVTLSKEGAIQEANLTAATLLGMDRQALIKQPLHRFILQDDQDTYYRHRLQHDDTAGPSTCDLRMVQPDRTIFWAKLVVTSAPRTDGASEDRVVISDITKSKQAEEALRQSEARIRTLSDSAKDAIVMMDQQGLITYWNPAAERIFGYTEQEAIGTDLHQLLAPQRYFARYATAIANFLKTGRGDAIGTTLELESRHKAGHEISIELSLSVLPVRGSRHTVGIIRDITQRKRTEEALRQSEEKYRLLFNSVNDAILIHDLQGWIKEVNLTACKRLGYTFAELTALSVGQLDSPADAQLVPDRMQRLMEHGELSFETVHRCKDGTPIFVEVNARQIIWEAQPAILSICRDITERKRTETTLLESERRFRDMLSNVKQIAIMLDLQGNITFCNDYLLEMTGWQRTEVLGKNWFDYFLPEAVCAQVKAVFAAAVKEGAVPVTYENAIITRTGEQRLIAWSNTVLHDDRGRIIGAASLGNDLTDQKRAKEALAANRAKSQFLANMSHEIRTPMNAILGMTHLAMESREGEQQQRFLQAIQQSAESLLGILNDILDFSKIEAGQLQLNSQPFRLAHLLETIVTTMQTPAAEKGLGLEVVMAPELPAAYVGDEFRLKQILLNLVGNAIKFTVSGSVTIGVELAADRCIAGKTALHFRVTDTGIGIPPDKLEEVFNSFEQVDNTYARRYGGSGLGLAISRQLTSLMGGTIWVDSLLNQGSTFHCLMDLPPWDGPLPDLSPDQPGAPAQIVRGLRILVVDDNAVNRDVARMLLEKEHHVRTADNGFEALRLLSQESFDVILMDVQMPLLDGLTTTAIIRALENGTPFPREVPEDLLPALGGRLANAHVTIVAMTAHAMVGDRERCLEAGMDGYITKPFQPAQLAEVFLALAAQNPTQVPGDQVHPTTVPGPQAQPACVQISWQEMAAHLEAATGLRSEQINRLLCAAQMSLADNLAKAMQALQEEDRPALAKVAHTLKGTLLQLGLDHLAAIAQDIDTGIRTDSDLPYATLLDTLQAPLAGLLNNGKKPWGTNATQAALPITRRNEQ